MLKTSEAKTQEATGKLVGWQTRQSQKVWALYRKGTIEEVLRKPQRYRLGKLSSQEMARLQRYLREFGANSLSEVRDLIKLMFEVQYSESGVCVLFQRLRIKLKTPRPSNIKKDERAVILEQIRDWCRGQNSSFFLVSEALGVERVAALELTQTCY